MASIIWESPPKPLEIKIHQIHLWRAEFDAGCYDAAAAEKVLADQELQRAARLVQENHRQRFCFSRLALRHILSQYLSIAPQEIHFLTGPHGKPFVKNKINITFNMSHSRDLIVYAVTRDDEVGIDIEWMNPRYHYQAIAKRFFAAEEYEYWRSSPPSQQAPIFYQIWTRKEAYLKALGLGLYQSLDEVSVLRHDSIIDIPIDPEYAAALALASETPDSRSIRYWQLTMPWD